jgi:hypothetical protein
MQLKLLTATYKSLSTGLKQAYHVAYLLQSILKNCRRVCYFLGKLREQSLLMPGGGAEDISKLMVNFSWPLILSKYFFHAPPLFPL